jgi:hypothetical protein
VLTPTKGIVCKNGPPERPIRWSFIDSGPPIRHVIVEAQTWSVARALALPELGELRGKLLWTHE